MSPYRVLLAVAIILYFGAAILFWVYGDPSTFAIFERIQGVVSVLGPWKTQPYAHAPLPFVDLGGVFSWRECYLRGVDVSLTNPCDLISRGPANYSPVVWHLPFEVFGLRNPIPAALAQGALFLLVTFSMFAPKNLKETAVAILAAISPPVFYALERSNLDLIIFAGTVGALLLSHRHGRSRALVYLAAVGGGLLKFYPFVLLATLVREPLRRCLPLSLAAASVIAIFIGANWSFLKNLALPKEDLFGMFGGRIIAKGIQEHLALDFSNRTAIYLSCCIISALAMLAILMRIKDEPRFENAVDRSSNLVFCGSIVTVACFFSGFNMYYRAIFLLPILAGLLSLRTEFHTEAMRRILRFVIPGILLCLYLDRARFLGMAFILSGAFIDPLSPIGRAAQLGIIVVKEAIWWSEVTILGALAGAYLINSRAVKELKQFASA